MGCERIEKMSGNNERLNVALVNVLRDEKIPSGRLMDNGQYQENDTNTSDFLRGLGFKILRLKTGTPARLKKDLS